MYYYSWKMKSCKDHFFLGTAPYLLNVWFPRRKVAIKEMLSRSAPRIDSSDALVGGLCTNLPIPLEWVDEARVCCKPSYPV